MKFLTKLIRRFGGDILLPSSIEDDEHVKDRDKVLTELNARLCAMTLDLVNQGRLQDYRGTPLDNKHN